jgi:DNA-binding CsgD family transcriptional regulator
MSVGSETGAPAVFGREAELDQAEAFLRGAGEGFGVLRIDGDPGIGKTTLWREIVSRASSRGLGVLSCRPAEAETNLALSAVADLFDEVGADSLSSLPAPQRHALEVALLRAEPESGPSDPRALAAGVRSLLAALGAGRPLLVAIDDVQWLDPSSAGVLDFALRRGAGTRVSWLFAARVPDPPGLAARVVPPEALEVIALGPMSLAAVHHMLKDRRDEPVSRPDLVRLHERAGGNPLFALEIARAGGAGRQGAAGGPVPQRLRQLVAERVPDLSAEARAALLAAAALSRPTAELVERASSASALSAAEESGLIRVDGGRISFEHPLYASAVYETASDARRRELHGHLAGIAPDDEERARHLAAAADSPSEDVALALEEASRRARQRGAWEAASELLESAGGLTPAELGDAEHRRLIAAAEHQIHAGGRPHARTLLEGVLATELTREQRAEALYLLGEVAMHDDDLPEATRLLAEALECAQEPQLLSRIELALGWLQPTFNDYAGGAPLADRAWQHAEEAADRSLMASALVQRAQFGFLTGQGVDWILVERSLAMEDDETPVSMYWRPSAVAALLELWTGEIQRARESLNRVLSAASERGDESDLAYVLLWLSWLELKSGNFTAAAKLADAMASSADLSGSRSLQAYALGQRALVHAHCGEVERTRALAAEATEMNEVMQQPQVVLWTASALGLLELSLVDPAAAAKACEPVAQGFEQQGIAEPVVTFCLPEALEAMIALGELDRAEPLLDQFQERGRELDRPWALATGGRCRGQLLAARGDIAGAADAVAEGLRAHERIEMPLELGRTLLVGGQIERRARQRRRANDSFARALAIFEELGAARWAERAEEEIERLGLRRSDPDELTQAERRVAEAAASGMTNREVAATLFLSPKTVEAHLSSAYRKLGIGSRAELGARMAADTQN